MTRPSFVPDHLLCSTLRSRRATLAELVAEYRSASIAARLAADRHLRSRDMGEAQLAAQHYRDEASAMQRRHRLTATFTAAAHADLVVLLRNEREAARSLRVTLDDEIGTAPDLDAAVAAFTDARAAVAAYLAAHPMCSACFHPLPSPTPEHCSEDWRARIDVAPSTCPDTFSTTHRSG